MVDDAFSELVTVASREEGRIFSMCMFLLNAVYAAISLAPRNASIYISREEADLEGAPTQEMVIADHDILPPGRYIIRLADHGALCATWSLRNITPTGLRGINLEVNEVISFGTTIQANARRLSSQKQKVSNRDHVCLLSGRAADVTLAHILAHAWYQNTSNRMPLLPQDIRDRINAVGISSPANAMLLSPGCAADYDRGYFAIRLNEGRQYEVVAITHWYMDFDGFILYDGARAEEIGACGVPPMDGDLLQFHLKCSVMRNMKASGQPEEDHWSEYDDVMEEIAQMLYDCTDLTPETISAGLDWCVLEQFLLDREKTCQPAKGVNLKSSATVELTDANTSGSSDE